jgi:glycosyltransferase involved in cell wall biosynthesis
MGQKSVLIVVQNLPVPMDRRVWLECQALRTAGYQVSVICPKGPGDPSRQTLEGISIYKYRPAPAARGLLGFAIEFVYCWLRTALLSVLVFARHRFSVLQACNPPDTYWALALLWRPFGVRFVFDQHDLNPELFRSRFGEPRTPLARLQLRVLLWLEHRTYRAANRVISTNESYRRIALTRGEMSTDAVTVVRSGPDTDRLRPVAQRPELRRGAQHLLAYLGIMGPQDNVDVLLQVVDLLVHRRGRHDVHLALLGFGDCLEDLRRTASELGLDDHVTFTDKADETMIRDYLSTAALGLAPDLKTPLNDVSTHNKIMEYMAFGLPVVSFDIDESRVSAGPCAVFVPSGDVAAFADAVEALLDDPARSAAIGAQARARCVDALDWRHQAAAYVGVFDGLTRRPVRVPVLGAPQLAGPAHQPGQLQPAGEGADRLIDLTDRASRHVRSEAVS